MELGNDPESLVIERLLKEAVEVGLFAHTIKQLWASERWTLVEMPAERAWAQLSLRRGVGPAWLSIRAFLRELWIE